LGCNCHTANVQRYALNLAEVIVTYNMTFWLFALSLTSFEFFDLSGMPDFLEKKHHSFQLLSNSGNLFLYQTADH